MTSVSIIVPVYNVSKYIVRCLDSVSNQTYKGTIECILVDDCGSDNSLGVCEEYVKNYRGQIKYKIVRREKNGGLSAARNSGIKVAKGDYLYFLDSDDEIPCNAMELLAAEVEKHPGIDVVMGFMEDEKKSDYYDISCFKDHQFTDDYLWIQYNSLKIGKNIPVNACNKLIKHQFILDNNLYFMEKIIHEDNQWFFFVIKNVRLWAFVFSPTYIRYYNDGSIMRTINVKNEVDSWIRILISFLNNLYEPNKSLMLYRYMSLYFGQEYYAQRNKNSNRLHWLFFKTCCEKGFCVGALYVLAWIISYNLFGGRFLYNRMKYYSYVHFLKESNYDTK